jgi:hypothetical protein
MFYRRIGPRRSSGPGRGLKNLMYVNTPIAQSAYHPGMNPRPVPSVPVVPFAESLRNMFTVGDEEVRQREAELDKPKIIPVPI